MDKIRELVTMLYGADAAGEICEQIAARIARMAPPAGAGDRYDFGAEDVVLITYGDTLRQDGEAPLQTLRRFAAGHLKEAFNTIHILPFYPYSSDDGFSVIDYNQVDPALGNWQDIDALRSHFRLMFDYVLNHISARSQWVRNYLDGVPGFEQLAIAVDPDTDLSLVTRPRALPLLTPFVRADGQTVHLWTTFSADQVDLNFADPAVFLRMLDVLLGYVSKGADLLRLDAIAYLWKEVGTTCIHLPQTHAVVRLMRAVLDAAAPHVVILTETNVPHAENISYLGSDGDEAQMVYNFTLPPLMLHTMLEADTTTLGDWARTLTLPSPDATFFNFTASHDGIGVRPLEGILPPEALDNLVAHVQRRGGRVSMRHQPDGTQTPYELNITYVDAMGAGADEPEERHIARFLASQAVQYVLPGVPATYIHSLLGSRNWTEGVNQGGQARSINREKLWLDRVEGELGNPHSFRSRVLSSYRRLIAVRRRQPALAPGAGFAVLDLDRRVFALRRWSATQALWALTNCSAAPLNLSLAADAGDVRLVDMLTDEVMRGADVPLAPYQYRWLVAA